MIVLILHKYNANYSFDWHFEPNILNHWHFFHYRLFDTKKLIRPFRNE